jgi:hypothetical protein
MTIRPPLHINSTNVTAIFVTFAEHCFNRFVELCFNQYCMTKDQTMATNENTIDPALWLTVLSQRFGVAALPPAADASSTAVSWPVAATVVNGLNFQNPSSALSSSNAICMPVMKHPPTAALQQEHLWAGVLACASSTAAASSQDQQQTTTNTTNSTWVPTVSETFPNPDEFLEKAKHYAQASGFTVAKSFAYNKDADAIAKNNGIKPVKQGIIYCCSLPGKMHEKNCPFHIVFGFRTHTNEYKVTSVHLSHSHTTSTIELDGRRHVNKLADLAQADLIIIHKIAEYCSNFWKAKEHIARKIPHKHISSELFRRQFIIAKEKIHGPNNGRMPQLFATGNDVKHDGGIFETTIDPITQRLGRVH